MYFEISKRQLYGPELALSPHELLLAQNVVLSAWFDTVWLSNNMSWNSPFLWAALDQMRLVSSPSAQWQDNRVAEHQQREALSLFGEICKTKKILNKSDSGFIPTALCSYLISRSGNLDSKRFLPESHSPPTPP